MYRKFFSFKEKPFRLVPNPKYFYLSKSNEEALAHLTYALSHGDGFVKITGDVGTGKTTLCRTFIENLKDNTEVGYIFNPKLNSIQLLKTINGEFGLFSNTNNLKDLIDIFNSFLLEKKAQRKKVILIIDEAHSLPKAVLEQIRLISNLETTHSKLLQIILVGQPELDNLLSSLGLRQLEQRISLSYRLTPLINKEAIEYIHHRIGIASFKPHLRFSNAAVRAICKYSKGIPRLINIACDRVLLAAYTMRSQRITGNIAKVAIRELTGTDHVGGCQLLRWGMGTVIFSILATLILTPHFTDGINVFKSSNFQHSQVIKANLLASTSDYSSVPIPESARASDRVENTIPKSSEPKTPSSNMQVQSVIMPISEKPLTDPNGKIEKSESDLISSTISAVQQQNTGQSMTFSIQAGAFLFRKNAEERIAFLKMRGYLASLEVLTDSQKRIWYTVRMGAYDNREDAKEVAADLTSKVNFPTSVRPFGAI